MFRNRTWGLRLLGIAALGGGLAVCAGPAHAQEGPTPVDPDTVRGFSVDGRVALHSLMSLSDGHLQETADALTALASTDAVRSADWDRIRTPLAETARMNVAGVYWFTLPDGTYWTVEQGRASSNLSDRPYFHRALAGETVIGELVVSRSTRLNSAIVAVPVRGPENSVVGVLGGSVELDSLSLRIRREMGVEAGYVFFAIDSQPIGALNSDPELIFTEPMKLGDENMERAFMDILSRQEGIVRYPFRGTRRTVLFRKSPVSGWWYGFGVIEP